MKRALGKCVGAVIYVQSLYKKKKKMEKSNSLIEIVT